VYNIKVEKELEKKFDEEFVRDDGLMDKYDSEGDTTAEAIKEWIDEHFIAKEGAKDKFKQSLDVIDNELKSRE
jgi:hypothetical protein